MTIFAFPVSIATAVSLMWLLGVQKTSYSIWFNWTMGFTSAIWFPLPFQIKLGLGSFVSYLELVILETLSTIAALTKQKRCSLPYHSSEMIHRDHQQIKSIQPTSFSPLSEICKKFIGHFKSIYSVLKFLGGIMR